MLQDKIQDLKKRREEIIRLEADVAVELKAELRGLPAHYGFDSPRDLYDAVCRAVGKKPGRKPGSGRQEINQETQEKVMSLTEKNVPLVVIAKQLGISKGSVANIRARNAPNALARNGVKI